MNNKKYLNLISGILLTIPMIMIVIIYGLIDFVSNGNRDIITEEFEVK